MTPNDLIKLALKQAGVVGIGQTPMAEDVNDALALLNMMLGQWNRKRWLVYHLVDVHFVATGALSYSIGPGGDINAVRPDAIEAAFVRLLNGSSNNQADFPLRVIASYEDYARIGLKTQAGFPQAVFLDTDNPYGTVYVWPVPNNACEIHLVCKVALAGFVGVADQIVLPPEYQEAMLYNLAGRLRSHYALPPDPTVTALARASLNTLRTANAQVPLLRMPSELVSRGWDGGEFAFATAAVAPPVVIVPPPVVVTPVALAGAVVAGATLTANLVLGPALSGAIIAGATLTGDYLLGSVIRGAIAAGATLTAARDPVFAGAVAAGAVLQAYRDPIFAGAINAGAVLTGSLSASTTWNPSDKNANITLSNGNRTATGAASGYKSVRGTTAKSSGKLYFEMLVVTRAADSGVGLAAATASLTNFIGSDSGAIGWFGSGGGVYKGGSSVTNVGQWVTGDRLGIAVDFTAGKLWFARNGVFSGDPVAGTSGIAIPSGTLFPAVTCTANDAFTIATAQADLTYSPPTGFSAWG